MTSHCHMLHSGNFFLCNTNNNCACQAEAERLLYEDADPEVGFMLHPDLKWVCSSTLDVTLSNIKLDLYHSLQVATYAVCLTSARYQ